MYYFISLLGCLLIRALTALQKHPPTDSANLTASFMSITLAVTFRWRFVQYQWEISVLTTFLINSWSL